MREIVWWRGVCFVPGDGSEHEDEEVEQVFESIMTKHFGPPMENPELAWKEACRLGELHGSQFMGVVPAYPEQLTGEVVSSTPFGH